MNAEDLHGRNTDISLRKTAPYVLDRHWAHNYLILQRKLSNWTRIHDSQCEFVDPTTNVEHSALERIEQRCHRCFKWHSPIKSGPPQTCLIANDDAAAFGTYRCRRVCTYAVSGITQNPRSAQAFPWIRIPWELLTVWG